MKVWPLVQNKNRLDRIIMRSSVFKADMACIALRSKKYNLDMWFKFDSNFLFDFGLRRCFGLFGAIVARQKLTQKHMKTEDRSEWGEPVY